MLINISDAQVVQPLLQRKSLSPEHLYLYSGKHYNPGTRVAGESLGGAGTELIIVHFAVPSGAGSV